MTPTPHLQAMWLILSNLKQASFYQDYIVRGSYVSRQYMQQYARPCQDLDFLYLKDYQPETLIQHIKALLQNSSLIKFQANQLNYQAIWEESISPGMRFDIPFELDEQSYTLQVDIACNDPLSSYPIEQCIDHITVQTVDLETLAAWKLHGLFEHLNGPWTSKTLWDLYIFCCHNKLDSQKFQAATQLAFSSRLDSIEVINRLLLGDFGNSKQSARYWKKSFPQFCKAEFIPLETVLTSIRANLKQHFSFPQAPSLLNLSDVIRYRVAQLRKLNTPEAKQKLKTLKNKHRVLPYKAYNTINHLPNSRLGSAEKHISQHQYLMLTQNTPKSSEYTIIVQEKLDGSCVCAYREHDEIFALGRAGDLAEHSANESRRLWAQWVEDNHTRFLQVLNHGERLCGEWLAMVHGTHYQLTHEPFVAFDLFTDKYHALPYSTFKQRLQTAQFVTPHLIHSGEPLALEEALTRLGNGHHGSIEKPEGLMYRLERDQRLLFRAKYVHHDKEDGCFLTEKTGQPEQWNWRP